MSSEINISVTGWNRCNFYAIIFRSIYAICWPEWKYKWNYPMLRACLLALPASYQLSGFNDDIKLRQSSCVGQVFWMFAFGADRPGFNRRWGRRKRKLIFLAAFKCFEGQVVSRRSRQTWSLPAWYSYAQATNFTLWAINKSPVPPHSKNTILVE